MGGGGDTLEFLQELTGVFPQLWDQGALAVVDTSGPKYGWVMLVCVPTVLFTSWNMRYLVYYGLKGVGASKLGASLTLGIFFVKALVILCGTTCFFWEVARSMSRAWSNIDQLLTLQSTITGYRATLPLNRQERIRCLRQAALPQAAQPPPADAQEDSTSTLSHPEPSEFHIAGLRQLDLRVKTDLLIWAQIRQYAKVDFAEETMFVDHVASVSFLYIATLVTIVAVVYCCKDLTAYNGYIMATSLISAGFFVRCLLKIVNCCAEMNDVSLDDINILVDMRWNTLIGTKKDTISGYDERVINMEQANLIDAMKVRLDGPFGEPQKFLGVITMTSQLKYSLVCSAVPPIGALGWKVFTYMIRSLGYDRYIPFL